jgi:high-affinity iron transporter
MALAALSFSAVAREGLETALFLFAGSTNATSATQFWLGGALGFLIAAVIGVLLYFGSARIPLKQFFLVTGLVVIVLAGGLMSNGLGELHAAGYFDLLSHRPWDTESTISMTSTLGKFLHTVLGYDSAPTTAQIIGFWGYIAAAGALFLAMPVQPPSLKTSAPPPVAIKPERGNA